MNEDLMSSTKLTFWEQIKDASNKAATVMTNLSRLMANVGGPKPGKRRLLMSVTQNILQYGAEIWADALKFKKYRERMAGVQYRGALRVACSYRTVSAPAVLVIAGIIPIDLLAIERKVIFERQPDIEKIEAKRQARTRSMELWQKRWEEDTRGRWTARLIKQLQPWVERKHGAVDFFLTQFLTGHGYFRPYLHRMGKIESPKCIYCEGPRDDAHHVFFVCERWQETRRRIESERARENTPENIINEMLLNEDRWDEVALFVQTILRIKKGDEDQIVRSQIPREVETT